MTIARLIPHADCLVCDWTPDPDARATVDRQAEKHTKEAGHSTRSWASPEVKR